MITFDSVMAKIRENFPKAAPSRSETLTWNRETAERMVSSDHRFRVTRKVENGTVTYWAEWCATVNSAPKAIGGRFTSFAQAKDAVEFLV